MIGNWHQENLYKTPRLSIVLSYWTVNFTLLRPVEVSLKATDGQKVDTEAPNVNQRRNYVQSFNNKPGKKKTHYKDFLYLLNQVREYLQF